MTQEHSASPSTRQRDLRRTLIGTVVSTKMQQTITVQVERMYRHPKYGKYLRERKRYHAHCEDAAVKNGDQVEIMAARPMSRLKRWRLVRIVAAAVERGAEVSDIAQV